METTPSRNSRLEPHPDDEWGRWWKLRRLHRMDRFPDASENSQRELPRSGLLLQLLELDGRPVAATDAGLTPTSRGSGDSGARAVGVIRGIRREGAKVDVSVFCPKRPPTGFRAGNPDILAKADGRSGE